MHYIGFAEFLGNVITILVAGWITYIAVKKAIKDAFDELSITRHQLTERGRSIKRDPDM